MAIQIGGTTVIDNSRNITNTVNITASGTISGDIVATQAVAEAGTDNTKLMTPLRVAQAIAALGGSVTNRIQRGSTSWSVPPFSPSASINIAVPVTSVNTAKSFISQANRFSGNAVMSARLTSSTNIQLTNGGYSGQSQGGSGFLDWELIEFK